MIASFSIWIFSTRVKSRLVERAAACSERMGDSAGCSLLATGGSAPLGSRVAGGCCGSRNSQRPSRTTAAAIATI
jgi:hypothetical protein